LEDKKKEIFDVLSKWRAAKTVEKCDLQAAYVKNFFSMGASGN
jgi:hypothetical protein